MIFFRKKPKRIRLPDVDPDTLVGGVREFRLLEPLSRDGNVSLLELAVLAGFSAQTQPGVIFEIGTFDGRSGLNLLANAPLESRLWTLDLPASQLGQTAFAVETTEQKYISKAVSGARIRGTTWQTRTTFLQGDSGNFDFIPYHGRCDIVFVDGSHAASYVRHDAETAWKLWSKTRGGILFHDYDNYNWPGVSQVLEALAQSSGPYRELHRIRGTSLAGIWNLGQSQS